MKITCHSCAAKYTVSDEKVQGKTVKMKCRKCGATIVVGGSSHTDTSTAEAAGEIASAAPDGQDLAPGSYLVNVNDGDQRTMTLAEIVAAYNSGVVNADTYVWADGMADWQPLSENETISGALQGGANGSTPAAPAYTPAAAPLAASPAPSPSRPESNRPAARRDGGRRGNDLFSGGMDGGLSSSVAAGGNAGKRDENSVLFSLSSLTSATPAASPSRSQTTATKEDSGLIDLKALAASGPTAAPATPTAVEPIGLFPLGAPVLAPPPVAAPAPSMAPAAEQKKSMVLPMVLGGGLIVAIAVAVFFAMKGTTPAQPTSTPQQPTQAAQAPTTPTPTVTQTATTPEPPASSAPVASNSSGPAKPPPGGGVYRPPPPPPPGGGGNIKPPPPPPPPGGGGGKCPCPPGDLMCAMQKCAGKK